MPKVRFKTYQQHSYGDPPNVTDIIIFQKDFGQVSALSLRPLVQEDKVLTLFLYS